MIDKNIQIVSWNIPIITDALRIIFQQNHSDRLFHDILLSFWFLNLYITLNYLPPTNSIQHFRFAWNFQQTEWFESTMHKCRYLSDSSVENKWIFELKIMIDISLTADVQTLHAWLRMIPFRWFDLNICNFEISTKKKIRNFSIDLGSIWWRSEMCGGNWGMRSSPYTERARERKRRVYLSVNMKQFSNRWNLAQRYSSSINTLFVKQIFFNGEIQLLYLILRRSC